VAVFSCIVCGARTRSLAHLYGTGRSPVPLCGFKCCRVFLADPLSYPDQDDMDVARERDESDRAFRAPTRD